MENTNNLNSENPVPTPKPQNHNQLISVIVVLVVLVIGFFLVKDLKRPPDEDKVLNSNEFENVSIDPVSPDEHIFGDAEAKILIVEYSDTECPYCKIFHNTLHKIVDENDTVAWVYRHYPIAGLHPRAFHEAVATECAWEQGGNDGFWNYTDAVYKITTSNNRLDPKELVNIAEELNLDMPIFNKCLNDEKYASKVEANISDGEGAGINGTPSSYIVVNGQVVDTILGADSYENISRKIRNLK